MSSNHDEDDINDEDSLYVERVIHQAVRTIRLRYSSLSLRSRTTMMQSPSLSTSNSALFQRHCTSYSDDAAYLSDFQSLLTNPPLSTTTTLQSCTTKTFPLPTQIAMQRSLYFRAALSYPWNNNSPTCLNTSDNAVADVVEFITTGSICLPVGSKSRHARDILVIADALLMDELKMVAEWHVFATTTERCIPNLLKLDLPSKSELFMLLARAYNHTDYNKKIPKKKRTRYVSEFWFSHNSEDVEERLTYADDVVIGDKMNNDPICALVVKNSVTRLPSAHTLFVNVGLTKQEIKNQHVVVFLNNKDTIRTAIERIGQRGNGEQEENEVDEAQNEDGNNDNDRNGIFGWIVAIFPLSATEQRIMESADSKYWFSIFGP